MQSEKLSDVIINNKSKQHINDSGRTIGIISEQRGSQQGTPNETILNHRNARHFIIDNIDTIIALNRKKAKKE